MSTDIARRGNTALARPSYIQEGDVRGTENITKDDVKFPALRLAQGTTPETKRSEAAKYIEGLREGEYFNSVTREIYGEDALHIVIVNMLGHRHVEFDPADRNVVLDGNVPDGDPRTEFTPDPTRPGKSLKPAATKFYDYLVMLVHGEIKEGELINANRPPELLTMSLKSTQLKKATELNTKLENSKLPSFAHLFSVTPAAEKKGNNNWYGWVFRPVGFVPEVVFNLAGLAYDKFLGKKVDVTDIGDAEGAQPGAPAGDDIPF